MDWMSQEGRKLLWSAYPDGYVAMRGVYTLGNWQCEYMDDPEPDGTRTSGWLRPPSGIPLPDDGSGEPPLEELGILDGLPDVRVDAGELLPWPDPGDVASWVCLLAEFQQALPIGPPDREITGYVWKQEWDKDQGEPYWILYWHTKLFRWSSPPYYIDCEDSAEALVRARALAREGKNRP